MLKKYNKFI